LHIDLSFVGSIDCLRALAAGRCLVAGFHVPALRDGSPVFARALKNLLKPGRHKLIGCTRRMQGLMVAKGNPLALGSLADLAKPGGRFVNRQPGSGTRLLLDHLLDRERIDAALVRGYRDAPEDHMSRWPRRWPAGWPMSARASGRRHTSSGSTSAVQRLRAALASATWHQDLRSLAGYVATRPGEVLALTGSLAWWNYRNARKGRPGGSARARERRRTAATSEA